MRTIDYPNPRQAGNTLLVTVITMAIMCVFIDLAMQYTNAVGRNVRRSLLLRQATNIGDASTEMAFSAWRAICRTNQTTIFKRSDFDNEIPTPTPGNFPGVSQYTLTNYAIYPLDSRWNTKTAGSATPAPIAGTASGDRSYYYLATADVVIPTISTTAGSLSDPNDPHNIVARVRRVFQKQILSLWRYAIFFTDDMEIHPGAPMTVNGDIHTNGNLFTGHNTLTLNGNTTYTDQWSIGFKNAAWANANLPAGDPGLQFYETTHDLETPSSPGWATGKPPSIGQSQQPYGVILDDYHQLIDYTTSATTLDPYRFQTQAGAVITIDASNNVKIYNSAGTDITNASSGVNKTMSTAIKSAVTTNQTITDNREGATTGNPSIRLATLDVSVITTAINTGKFGNFNGIIYITDISAGSTGFTNKRGIRLKNGAKLPDGTSLGSAAGLTVASANPIYVQGDYNTGTTGVAQPMSNSSDPTQPTVIGYTRQPAAIIGDAVNILSNSWNDALSGSVPAASNTTVNAGIISGIVPSSGGYYSGGVENFPRFLEDWSGKTFTYYGSMLQLYNSQQAIGHWGAANVYSPPDRAWYFDANFVSKPPPGILASYDYIRSRWYMQ